MEAVIAPLDELMDTLDVPFVIALDAEVQVGAAPEPAEVNTWPDVPADPVKVNAVVILADARVGLVNVGLVPNTFAPVPVIVVVEM